MGSFNSVTCIIKIRIADVDHLLSMPFKVKEHIEGVGADATVCDSFHFLLQHPISRFIARYICEPQEKIYERHLHFVSKEVDKIQLRSVDWDFHPMYTRCRCVFL